jgi:hypothetical protein
MNGSSVSLSAISFTYDFNSRYFRICEAIEAIAEHPCRIVLLPGYSLNNNSDTEDKLHVLTNLAAKYGIHLLAEVSTGAYFHFLPSGNVGNSSFTQLFWNSSNATITHVEKLCRMFETKERIVEITGVRLGILLCGENNVLTNTQSRMNEAKLRHPSLAWPFGYDVLVNPSHTSMGNWGKLHKRFSYFSSGNRVLVYCTNNTRRYSWKSALSVYIDGQKIMDGETASQSTRLWRVATTICPTNQRAVA